MAGDHLCLLPGETRRVTVSWRSGTRSPRIVLDGYCVPAVTS
jgi:hypothetical protein